MLVFSVYIGWNYVNILHTECSMNWGGQEYRTLLEHDYLNKNSHKSWIMCHPESALFKKGRTSSYNIIPINLSKSWNIFIAIEILMFCIKNEIDLINSHGGKDSTLCLLSFFSGFPLIRSRHITSRIKKRLSYQFFCSHVIATAKVIKDILIDVGVEKNKITVIGEGVDLNEYKKSNDSSHLKKEFKICDEFIVVNIGMIRKDKGQEYYIKAAHKIIKKYKNVKFFLVGGNLRHSSLGKELHDMVKLKGISNNFIFTGYREDVSSFIHMADLIVVSSIAVEAQSRIVPQSFATGKTVVSTNIGGLTELVDHEVNGLVVPAKNSEVISDAISRLIENEQLKKDLENRAYSLAVEKLSFDKMMEDTFYLYNKYV